MATGKELVIDAIEGKKCERTPWVPFCGVHAAKLIGCDAEEYLKNPEKIIDGITRAVEEYRPDGLPVLFDLQVEAEILGCKLHWSKDNPPSVVSHPLAENNDLLDKMEIIKETDGRNPMIAGIVRELRTKFPDIALYGLITGPFTLALHLLGADIFMKMFDNPEYVHKVMAFCTANAKVMSKLYIDNGCDVIAMVDPMTSQIGPEQFEEFCLASSCEIFDYIHALNSKGSFFVCGHAQKNISIMCESHCDNVSIDENIPLDYVKEICRDKKVSFGGNLELTTVLLFGTEEENRIHAVECMDIGGTEGFLLAPGCDIPFDTPSANIKAVADVVHDNYQREITREIAKNRTGDNEVVEKPDYSNKDHLIIDVVTLDSSGCAPCQYMHEAITQAASEFGDQVEIREYKIKTKEGIDMMKALGVSNIPTACFNGNIEFISNITDRSDIIEKIRSYL